MLEWSRLLIGLNTGLSAPPGWLLEASVSLFDRAIADGWLPEPGGFGYTVDFNGAPVVTDRLHWVAAEAIGAAATLSRVVGGDRFEFWYRRCWDWTEARLIDRAEGSWRHELNNRAEPTAHMWPGKPDVYHSLQATLVGRLPAVSSFARGIAEGRLGL
jgi:sulfoquinovose isomerase